MRPNKHPNGAPDASQLAYWAIWAPRMSPGSAKGGVWKLKGALEASNFNRPRQPPGRVSPQGRPQELPDLLQASIYQLSGLIVQGVGAIFLGFSLPVSTFLHGLPKGAD